MIPFYPKQDNIMNEETQIEPYNNKNSALALSTQFTEIDKLVDSIVNSELGKPFRYKDSDGKDQVNKSDIVANIVLGHELGLTPMASVVLGKRLTIKSYFSVVKGKTLGVDPVTAINKIYNIPTGNGDMVVVGVDIIEKVLLDCNVKYDILEDSAPIYNYYQAGRLMDNDEALDNDILRDKFEVIYPTSTAADVKRIMDSGKIPITKKEYTKRTKIRFVRKEKDIDITISYTLQQAIDAGLYLGYHSKQVGNDNKPLLVEGKDNWNKNPETMLRNRTLSIGGRIIAADKLNGVYTDADIPAEVKTIDIEHQDVQ